MNLKTLFTIIAFASVISASTIILEAGQTIKTTIQEKEYSIQLIALSPEQLLTNINGEQIKLIKGNNEISVNGEKIFLTVTKINANNAEINLVQTKEELIKRQLTDLTAKILKVNSNNVRTIKTSKGYSSIYNNKKIYSKFTRQNYCLIRFNQNLEITNAWCKT